MRKLVLILIASIALVTFIRAFDNSAGMLPVENLHAAGAINELESDN